MGGFHHKIIDNNIANKVENILGGKDEQEKMDNMFGCRLIVIDSESILNILDQLKECSLKTQIPENELFNKITMNCVLKENDKKVGIHLNIPGTEYEIGWLVYNDINELIAIVYDKYNVLEGELKVDDKVSVSLEEYNKIIEKRKEIERKAWEKYQIELEEKDQLDIEQIFNNRGDKSIDIIVDELIELGFIKIDILVTKYKTIYNDIDNIIELFNKKIKNK